MVNARPGCRARFHVTPRAIEWRVQKDKFPKPYPFSHKNRLWLISDIEAYEAKAKPTAQVLSPS
jgi:hypothetical protein